MLNLQIKVLRKHYGWEPKDIAELLKQPISVVNMHIEEMGLAQGVEYTTNATSAATTYVEIEPEQAEKDNQTLPAVPTIQTSSSPVEVSESLQEYEKGLEELKTGEVSKQLEIAPLLAVIELDLIGSLMEAARDAQDASPNGLALLVDTYKRLTKDSFVNGISKMEATKVADATGGQQVIIQVAQFND